MLMQSFTLWKYIFFVLKRVLFFVYFFATSCEKYQFILTIIWFIKAIKHWNIREGRIIVIDVADLSPVQLSHHFIIVTRNSSSSSHWSFHMLAALHESKKKKERNSLSTQAETAPMWQQHATAWICGMKDQQSTEPVHSRWSSRSAVWLSFKHVCFVGPES